MHFDFNALSVLTRHATYIENIFPDQKLFIVGGTIRDLLLGRDTAPDDIDLTGWGDPDQIRESMQFDEATMSRFRTEKFGTMTVIPKLEDGSSSTINYELTPFRAEGDYTDSRHPDTIVWSDSLVSDSARRDFTINALYRSALSCSMLVETPHTVSKKDLLQTLLQKKLPVVIVDASLLILTEPTQIQTYIQTGTLPTSALGVTTIDTQQKPTPTQTTTSLKHIIIDPQGGLLDLMARKIRTVGDPATRYQEDALRLMRGLRFVNVLNQGLPGGEKQNSGFDFEKRTREQLVAHADRIAHVASERHYQELWKVFTYNNPFGYISTLKTAGLMKVLFPSLTETINNHQPTRHHALDTFSHTLMVLYHLQQRCDDPLVRFATLFHDVGKPEQYAFMERAKAVDPINPDREGFEHHAEISVRLAQVDLKNLSFPKASIEKICRYIKRHHRPGEILDSNPKKHDHKIRKLMSDGGYEETLKLIDLAIADRLGQYNPIQSPAIEELLQMQERVTQLYAAEGRFTQKDLAVNGSRLINTFHLTPGPQIGEILARVFEWVLGDIESRNTEKQIEMLVKGLV